MKIIKFLTALLIASKLITAENLEFPKISILRQIPSDHNKRFSSYPFISGDTFRSSCDFIIDKTNNSIKPDNVKDGDTIFIAAHTQFLDFFFQNVHPKIKSKYILVTHNSDKSNFDSYVKYLEDEHIVAWFGVNLTIHHKKALPIPIGISNAYWPHGNTTIIKNVMSNIPETKNILLYMNFAVNTNKNVRQKVANIFSSKNFCHKAGRRKFQDYLSDLSRSKFILSPEGNGLDCHRPWESMLMGAIPIVTHSKIDKVFKNLPVLIIDDWNQITKEYLETKYEEIKARTYKKEKLFAEYWINKILKYKAKAKKTKNFESHFSIGFNESMSQNRKYNQNFANNNKDWIKIKSLFDEHILHNPQYSETPKIPKIIHQIWLGNNGKLPAKYKAFQKSWIDTHPDWQYKLWTEKEIDEFGLKNRKQYEQTKNYGVKSDIARYEILYRLGGLYVDTDFECLKSFEVLHHICDFYTGSAYGKDVSFLNGLIGSAPEHPVLLECINNIKSTQKIKENYNDITNRTGPQYLTKCFFKAISHHNGPSVVFPVTYFYPWPNYYKDQNSFEQVRKWIKPESFAIHHWFVAWNK